MRIDNSELQKVLDEVRARFGLVFESSRYDELRQIIRERAHASNCGTVREFLAILKTSEAEWQEVANRLTVPETYFFRIPEHFAAFTADVVPARIKARASERVLRLASVGCASGEEPYTMAMVLHSRFGQLASWSVEINAYDVSANALKRAARGIYSDWSLRAIPTEMRNRYFTKTKRGWELDAQIRRMVRFETRNVLDMCSEPSGAYDVVFFRNVLIYFSPESARAAVACIARMMVPGAFLFLGTAETLRGLSNDFSLNHTHEAFYYQRAKAGAAAALVQRPSVSPKTAPVVTKDARFDEVGSLRLEHTPPTVSWLEHIRDSSERISELTSGQSVRSAPGKKKTIRNAALQSAMAMFASEKYSAALAELDALDADDRADADVQLLRAVLLTNAHKIDAAKRAATHALQLDHLHAEAHYVLALCGEHNRDLPLALQHDVMAAFLDPAFAMPHLHAAAIHRRLGAIDQACAELERARLLLAGEDAGRILLFGGGFSREALVGFCERQLLNCRGAS